MPENSPIRLYSFHDQIALSFEGMNKTVYINKGTAKNLISVLSDAIEKPAETTLIWETAVMLEKDQI